MRVIRTEFLLRDRHFWECVDLAGLMYRRWLGPLLLFFGLPLALLASGLLAFLDYLPPWLPALLLWWLKPLWDRLVMIPAGLLLFDPEASFRTLAKGLLGRVFFSGLLGGLSWRRFSPYRAYLLPVDMYERPARAERARRKKWLGTESAGRLAGITALFLTLELVVATSLSQTISILSAVDLLGYHTEEPWRTAFLLNLVYALTILFVEPLYTLTCFSVYVNRRTSAEGWDLQLAFHRLRSRLPGSATGPAAAVLILAFFFQAGTAQAQAHQPPLPEGLDSAFVQRAREVLAGDEFGRTEMRTELRLKLRDTTDGETPSTESGDSFINRWGAEILRVLALGAGLTLVVLALVMNRHRLPLLRQYFKKKKGQAVETLPAAPESLLTGNWIEEGRLAWDGGRFRDALGLLYRGSIDLAGRRYGIRVPDSATEGECLRAVKRSGAATSFTDTFEELTRVWIGLAWAGIVPEDEAFDRLCRNLSGLRRGV